MCFGLLWKQGSTHPLTPQGEEKVSPWNNFHWMCSKMCGTDESSSWGAIEACWLDDEYNGNVLDLVSLKTCKTQHHGEGSSNLPGRWTC